MCTHQRFVFNRYTKTSFFAKCGKCKACLQEKAYKRSYRIKMENSPDKICLFITLTYDRGSCPFVYQSDIDARKDVLPVYREFSTRRVKKVLRSGQIAYLDRRIFDRPLLNEIYAPDYESFRNHPNIKHLAYRPDHLGICYYPDIQLFKKRLNINLKRKYNYYGEYKCFSCSEYGSRSGRPHFHMLMFIRPNDETLFRAAILEAWPFASKRRTAKYIEIARDAANYVASYVNCGENLHRFLSSNFKTKHSYSKDFGMADKLFSMDSILSKIDKRDLSYLRAIGQKGKEEYIDFPIPKYVINRYFPLFKGYSRFTDFEILDVLRSFIQSGTKQAVTPLISLDKLLSIDYNKDDLHKISVRVTNAYEKYLSFKNMIPSESAKEDYIMYFIDCWKVYRSTKLRLWYEDNSIDPKYKYDNTQALRGGLLYSPDTLHYLDSSDSQYIDNPNEYPQVVSMTAKYEGIYNFRSKEKKLNNFVMAQNNYYF